MIYTKRLGDIWSEVLARPFGILMYLEVFVEFVPRRKVGNGVSHAFHPIVSDREQQSLLALLLLGIEAVRGDVDDPEDDRKASDQDERHCAAESGNEAGQVLLALVQDCSGLD